MWGDPISRKGATYNRRMDASMLREYPRARCHLLLMPQKKYLFERSIFLFTQLDERDLPERPQHFKCIGFVGKNLIRIDPFLKEKRGPLKSAQPSVMSTFRAEVHQKVAGDTGIIRVRQFRGMGIIAILAVRPYRHQFPHPVVPTFTEKVDIIAGLHGHIVCQCALEWDRSLLL